MKTDPVEILKQAGDTPVIVVFRKGDGRLRQVRGTVEDAESQTHVVIKEKRGYRAVRLDSIHAVVLKPEPTGNIRGNDGN